MIFNKYFDSTEFDSPDKRQTGRKMNRLFISRLTAARLLAGVPFIINSGFRTKEHNDGVGGVNDSAHTKGLAADIRTTNPTKRARILYGLVKAGFTRIGIHVKYIHVDMDEAKPHPSLWLY